MFPKTIVLCQCYRIGFINFFYRAFLCILAYFYSSTSRIVTFFTAIYFFQIDNSGPLISHFFKITNHQSIIFLKLSIYIQIVIRLASIHRLSICIIDLPTTGKYTNRDITQVPNPTNYCKYIHKQEHPGSKPYLLL